jgi:hypothetical protein
VSIKPVGTCYVCFAGQSPASFVGRELESWGKSMLVVMRFDAKSSSPSEAESLQERQKSLVQALSGAQGFRNATLGRSPDDPGQWVIVTRWVGVGSFRRGLSGFDVKLALGALASESVDTTSVFEVVGESDGQSWTTRSSDRSADADTTGPGDS